MRRLVLSDSEVSHCGRFLCSKFKVIVSLSLRVAMRPELLLCVGNIGHFIYLRLSRCPTLLRFDDLLLFQYHMPTFKMILTAKIAELSSDFDKQLVEFS